MKLYFDEKEQVFTIQKTNIEITKENIVEVAKSTKEMLPIAGGEFEPVNFLIEKILVEAGCRKVIFGDSFDNYQGHQWIGLW